MSEKALSLSERTINLINRFKIKSKNFYSSWIQNFLTDSLSLGFFQVQRERIMNGFKNEFSHIFQTENSKYHFYNLLQICFILAAEVDLQSNNKHEFFDNLTLAAGLIIIKLECPHNISIHKEQILENNLDYEGILQAEILLLNKLSWSLDLESPSEIVLHLACDFFPTENLRNFKSSQVYGYFTDMLDYAVSSSVVYLKFDLFVITMTCMIFAFDFCGESANKQQIILNFLSDEDRLLVEKCYERIKGEIEGKDSEVDVNYDGNYLNNYINQNILITTFNENDNHRTNLETRDLNDNDNLDSNFKDNETNFVSEDEKEEGLVFALDENSNQFTLGSSINYQNINNSSCHFNGNSYDKLFKISDDLGNKQDEREEALSHENNLLYMKKYGFEFTRNKTKVEKSLNFYSTNCIVEENNCGKDDSVNRSPVYANNICNIETDSVYKSNCNLYYNHKNYSQFQKNSDADAKVLKLSEDPLSLAKRDAAFTDLINLKAVVNLNNKEIKDFKNYDYDISKPSSSSVFPNLSLVEKEALGDDINRKFKFKTPAKTNQSRDYCLNRNLVFDTEENLLQKSNINDFTYKDFDSQAGSEVDFSCLMRNFASEKIDIDLPVKKQKPLDDRKKSYLNEEGSEEDSSQKNFFRLIKNRKTKRNENAKFFACKEDSSSTEEESPKLIRTKVRNFKRFNFENIDDIVFTGKKVLCLFD